MIKLYKLSLNLAKFFSFYGGGVNPRYPFMSLADDRRPT